MRQQKAADPSGGKLIQIYSDTSGSSNVRQKERERESKRKSDFADSEFYLQRTNSQHRGECRKDAGVIKKTNKKKTLRCEQRVEEFKERRKKN